MTRTFVTFGLAALCIVAMPAGAQQERMPLGQVAGAAQVVSGDLLLIEGAQIRLHGLDAPDPGQTCETRYSVPYDCHGAARQVMERMINGDEVTCWIRDRDRNGQDIGTAALIYRGWALAYRDLTGEYSSIEARAQSRRHGMWSGRVEAPWLWRSRMHKESMR